VCVCVCGGGGVEDAKEVGDRKFCLVWFTFNCKRTPRFPPVDN
jgi:hypothetical protein